MQATYDFKVAQKAVNEVIPKEVDPRDGVAAAMVHRALAAA